MAEVGDVFAELFDAGFEVFAVGFGEGDAGGRDALDGGRAWLLSEEGGGGEEKEESEEEGMGFHVGEFLLGWEFNGGAGESLL